MGFLNAGQGAPRTCRCIETPGGDDGKRDESNVREHHAPVGALRLKNIHDANRLTIVREHHAPVGALRPDDDECHADGDGESGSTTHL